jgi:hypothetical protein
MPARKRTVSFITCIALLLTLAGTARADIITFSGSLDPGLDSSLTAWDQVGATYVAPYDSGWDRAWNISVHTFDVTIPGLVTFASDGYGLGGFDAVLSIFAGTGNAASYLYHQYAPVAGTDFSFDVALGPGTFTLAVSNFANEPCAYGYCFVSGVFGDGFTNLVNYDESRGLEYHVVVTTPTEPGPVVPEPMTGLLVLTGLGILSRKRL